ncbi:MAG: beta-N-acetylhexosaminidase [Candidatus Krumholzibacteriia bacterium]
MPPPDTPLALIPHPRSVTPTGGSIDLDRTTTVHLEPGPHDLAAWAAPLLDLLRRGMGLPLPIVDASSAAELAPAQVAITLGHLAGHGPEAYTLDIDERRVTLRAGDREGLVWGLQTLRQLLPADMERPLPPVADDPGRPDGRLGPEFGGAASAASASGASIARDRWPLPCVRIADRPRFGWRGLLLDSCRHFQDLAGIERVIELMSLHKLNRLHWHLTEDQGWRLEIRSRPRLTEVGAWRMDRDGVRYGGYYTQDEARHVVAFAAARGITVVPEIELPGHCRAALASYPELGCRGRPLPVATEWGVFEDIYCAGNPAVCTFLEEVLAEVLAIFPSRFIHLGGDECPPDRWLACPRCRARMEAAGLQGTDALHGWFVQRVARWLADQGRRAIGWDEVLAGGLAPGAVVQSWRGFEGAQEAVRRGHDAIVSPISHMYLDQDPAKVDLARVLAFDPAGGDGGGGRDGGEGRVLGGELCLWTERIPQAAIDPRTWPRACAGSEVLWSERSADGLGGRDLAEFARRLDRHARRLRALGVKAQER